HQLRNVELDHRLLRQPSQYLIVPLNGLGHGWHPLSSILLRCGAQREQAPLRRAVDDGRHEVISITELPCTIYHIVSGSDLELALFPFEQDRHSWRPQYASNSTR